MEAWTEIFVEWILTVIWEILLLVTINVYCFTAGPWQRIGSRGWAGVPNETTGKRPSLAWNALWGRAVVGGCMCLRACRGMEVKMRFLHFLLFLWGRDWSTCLMMSACITYYPAGTGSVCFMYPICPGKSCWLTSVLGWGRGIFSALEAAGLLLELTI